jgi:hypothetical protein
LGRRVEVKDGWVVTGGGKRLGWWVEWEDDWVGDQGGKMVG